MSAKPKEKKLRKKPRMSTNNYASKLAGQYCKSYQHEMSSFVENTSVTSLEDERNKSPTFPFKQTPSGNLKVQTNQVVFQSSTVGVLLADPSQAEVKIKFEGKSTDDDNESSDPSDGQYDVREINFKPTTQRTQNLNDLKALGYTISTPIDGMRVQLPKKRDLYQEFFKRLHNQTRTSLCKPVKANSIAIEWSCKFTLHSLMLIARKVYNCLRISFPQKYLRLSMIG